MRQTNIAMVAFPGIGQCEDVFSNGQFPRTSFQANNGHTCTLIITSSSIELLLGEGATSESRHPKESRSIGRVKSLRILHESGTSAWEVCLSRHKKRWPWERRSNLTFLSRKARSGPLALCGTQSPDAEWG